MTTRMITEDWEDLDLDLEDLDPDACERLLREIISTATLDALGANGASSSAWYWLERSQQAEVLLDLLGVERPWFLEQLRRRRPDGSSWQLTLPLG